MVIYKTTNLINNKIYIGQDSKNNPNYLGSGLLLKKAIKKYGKDNFTKEILEHCYSKEELDTQEQYWISKFDSIDLDIGYNIMKGGEGGDTISNHPNRKEICEKMKLKEYSKLERLNRSERVTGKNNPLYGKHKLIFKRVICEKCGKEVDDRNYTRWHGEKCGTKPMAKLKCEFCGKEGFHLDILTHHNEYCKLNPNKKKIERKPLSDEVKSKMNQSKKNKPLSEEHRNKLSLASKNKKKTKEHGEKLGKILEVRNKLPKPRIKCEYCGLEITKNNYTMWHGEKCKNKN
jgi:group I intron endonuclease